MGGVGGAGGVGHRNGCVLTSGEWVVLRYPISVGGRRLMWHGTLRGGCHVFIAVAVPKAGEPHSPHLSRIEGGYSGPALSGWSAISDTTTTVWGFSSTTNLVAMSFTT